jgi:hypothetical protein
MEEAADAYKTFEKGEACKYLIDPHGMLSSPVVTMPQQKGA